MDNWKLDKIKLQEDLGVFAHYKEKVRKDENEYWLDKSVKSMIHRHPDLSNVADKMSLHVARIYGILGIGLYKEESDMNKSEKQHLQDTLDSIHIISISISGEEESQGCVISAKRNVLGKKTIIMNTPFITFSDDMYDYSYELGVICKELSDEVYAYIFDRKFAQLEIFSQSPEEEESMQSEQEQIDEVLAGEKLI